MGALVFWRAFAKLTDLAKNTHFKPKRF